MSSFTTGNNFNQLNNNVNNNNINDALINPNEMSMFFQDILKNKEMIKQMLYTNLLIYQDQVQSNDDKIKEIKEELEKIDSDFQIVENKLKLEFAKCHDNVQKHDINYKLLNKTYSHYRTLIVERESEIRKLEEKLLFAEQDYQNKKIKLDCLNIQIIEAEFQLKNMNSKLNENVENIIEEGDTDSIIEFRRKIENSENIINKDEMSFDNKIFKETQYENQNNGNIAIIR